MTERVPHILVVDDDWMNREVIEAYLLTENYRVSTAPTGNKALDILTADLPDLILLDVMLPDMSGFEVCQHIKSHDQWRFIPVVMVTALEDDEDKLKAVQAGADDFVTKPFSSVLMLTRVRSLLKAKYLHDELEASNHLLQRVLSRYVGHDLAQLILIDPERHLRLGGETRPLTILFADISGFTTFAEQHAAQDVVHVLNTFFSALTPLVFKHNGTFDKYIGDAIMAFFGAPITTGDEVLNALALALDMQAVFKNIRAELGRIASELTLTIGVHQGEVVVGNVGSEQVMSYTVIGDAVNTAHRLQNTAQGDQIIISKAIYDIARDFVRVNALPPAPLPGKRESIPRYELLGWRG